MGAQRQTFITDLSLKEGMPVGPKNLSRGKIIVRADHVAQSNDEVKFRIHAQLPQQGGFCCGSDNPYVVISRAIGYQIDQPLEKVEFMRVHMIPMKNNNHRPNWGE